MNSAEYWFYKENEELENSKNKNTDDPMEMTETIIDTKTIYKEKAEYFAELVCGQQYINKEELSLIFESNLKIFIVEFLERDSIGTLERDKMKINDESASLLQEKIRLEKKLIDAKDDVRFGNFVDKKWMSDLDFQIKNIGIKVGKNQQKLYKIGLLQKEQRRNKAEIAEKSFKSAAKEMLDPEKYEEILESIQQRNDERQIKIQL